MTEPEQWARELLDAVFDASDLGSACGIVDCPQCANAALSIQRAFEEREWKLREAATTQPSGDVVEAVARAIAETDGLDWDEKCGHETDQEECDSGTCVAAFVEDHDPDWARSVYRAHATAAITTYEAVSGVAKMREALRAFAFVGEDCPKGTQAVWEMIYRDRVQDWFSYEDFEAARAALGEKP